MKDETKEEKSFNVKRSTPPAPRRHLSRNGIQEGVCKGCGGATRWRKGGRDSFSWHSRCYQRVYKRRIRGWPWSERRLCVVCGRPFLARGQGSWNQRTCSPACTRKNKQTVTQAYEIKIGRLKWKLFSRHLKEGLCLGCGMPTRKGRRSYGKKDTIRWHGACYYRVSRIHPEVRRKLIAIHREFGQWLAAWEANRQKRLRAEALSRA